MEYFNAAATEFAVNGAEHTAREIWDQPRIWKLTFQKLLKERKAISAFFEQAVAKSSKIILTGAGTSAYIGLSLEGTFHRLTGKTTVSIPTTHMVTHAVDYLDPDQHIFMISFARSGNSPESVAALKLADNLSGSCSHLVITCDAEGDLAKYQSASEKYTFVLPDESNDRSLAMTSSYSGMLLTGLLLPRLNRMDEYSEVVETLADYGSRILKEYSGKIRELAKKDFKRAVVLGSGPLFGTCTESHLKLQELTDGQVICKRDTFLAFRHGPKAVIDEQTIVICIFSNNPSVQRYERDFVNSLDKGKKAMCVVGISESKVDGIRPDIEITFGHTDGKILEEDMLTVCSVLPAQILGMFKSIELGLKPDNPSESGAIARVVEGVKIYDI